MKLSEKMLVLCFLGTCLAILLITIDFLNIAVRFLAIGEIPGTNFSISSNGMILLVIIALLIIASRFILPLRKHARQRYAGL